MDKLKSKTGQSPERLSAREKKEKRERVRAKIEKLANDTFASLIQDYTSPQKQKVLADVKSGRITKQQFIDEVSAHLAEKYALKEMVAKRVIKMFDDYVFGYSRITDLINDDEISDIHCIAWNNIRVKRKGQRMSSGISFSSEQEFDNFVQAVATKNKVSISSMNAIQRFTDSKTNEKFILRFTISTQVVNAPDHPYMVVRKVPKDFPRMDDLVDVGMLDDYLKEFLIQRFREGSLLVCGGNSSGKTTFLNALKETIPHNRSVLVCQQAEELTSKDHPDMFFLNELPPTSESAVSYDLKNISIMGLTFDIDYFLIGEVKGAEALYLLNAAYTGQICAATIHADDARHGLNKLADYALYESHYNREELLKMLVCFKTIVFMKKYKVTQIVAVNGWNEEQGDLDYRLIYQRDQSHDNDDIMPPRNNYDHIKVED